MTWAICLHTRLTLTPLHERSAIVLVPPGVTRAFQTAGTASRLLLEIDVGERLPAGVADDEAGAGFVIADGQLAPDQPTP